MQAQNVEYNAIKLSLTTLIKCQNAQSINYV